ncbi:MAG: hypothetical protein JWO60_1805 [Frankiales bacterium]|nr:hypothetical protein [Frankiales bacterium]
MPDLDDPDPRPAGARVHLTWTVLRCRRPPSTAPWSPVGASWWEAGHGSPGRAQPPPADGSWWSVLATWPDPGTAAAGPPSDDDVDAWHVVLEPVSAHGDVVLAGGARPFEVASGAPPLAGPVALVTVAGASADDGREREFFRRFLHVSRDLGGAAGHLLSLVHVPADAPDRRPVLTLSVWQDVASAVDWAYSGSRPHTSAVARQGSHRLVRTSGSVRCAVRSSTGSLGAQGDPLAGLLVRSAPA